MIRSIAQQFSKSSILWTLAVIFVLGLCHFYQQSLHLKSEVSIDQAQAQVIGLRKYPNRNWLVVKFFDRPGMYGASFFGKLNNIRENDHLLLTGQLKPLTKTSQLAGSIDLDEPPVLHERPQPSFWQKMRSKYWELCQKNLGDETKRLTPALLLGDRSEFFGPIHRRFQLTGTLHYLALSGLHVGLILLPFLLVMRFFRLTPRVQIAICLPLLTFYLCLTGPLPSLVRAALSFVFLAIGTLTYKRLNKWNTLCAVAIACLVIQPQQIHSAGFAMTFSALGGILFLSPHLMKLWPSSEPPLMWKAISFNTGAWLGIAPVLLWFFDEVYPGALLVNLILIPLITILLTLAMVLPLAASIFAPLIDATWQLTDQILIWSLQFLHRPWGPEDPQKIALILGITVILIGIQKKTRPWIFTALLLICLLSITWQQPLYTFQNPRVSQLPVGQGSSYFVEFKANQGFLVDCGGSRFQVGKRVIATHLRKHSIKKIETIFLTHLDQDHCNGLEDILARFHVGSIALNSDQVKSQTLVQVRQLCELYRVSIIELERGHHAQIGPLQINVKHPTKKSPGPKNERSLVLEVKGSNKSILFTGDIDERGTKDLLLRDELNPVDILTAPHHGSRNKFFPLLLEVLQPKEIWLSARQSFPQEPSILNFPILKSSWQGLVESDL